jgi:hypothetical protein
MGKGAGGNTADPVHNLPRDPAPKRKLITDGFPPQYNSIRAARSNTSTITPLGGIGGGGGQVTGCECHLLFYRRSHSTLSVTKINRCFDRRNNRRIDRWINHCVLQTKMCISLI